MEDKKEKEYRRAIRLDWLLDELDKAETPETLNQRGLIKNTVISKDYFNNATLLFGTSPENGENTTDIYFKDVKLRDLPPVWDACFCMFGRSRLTGQKEEQETVFHRVRRRPLSDFRGYGTVGEAILEHAQYSPQGTPETGLVPFRVFWAKRGSAWLRIYPNMNERGAIGTRNCWKDAPEYATDYNAQTLQVGMSVAFSQRYQWLIRFKNKKQLSVRVVVHPLEIAELFALREKKPDWTRRKALKHWVTRHWRRVERKEGFDIFTYIRDYLRGEREFDWFGLECKIIIPSAELELVDRLKRERQQMREETPRADRRTNYASEKL